MHSTARTLAFGVAAAFTRHLGAHLAIFTVPNHLDLDRQELFYGVPRRLANVYSARQNMEALALLVFASPPLRYDRRDVGQQKRILANAISLGTYAADTPDGCGPGERPMAGATRA